MHDGFVIPVAVSSAHFVAGFEARAGAVAGGRFAGEETAGEGAGRAGLDECC